MTKEIIAKIFCRNINNWITCISYKTNNNFNLDKHLVLFLPKSIQHTYSTVDFSRPMLLIATLLVEYDYDFRQALTSENKEDFQCIKPTEVIVTHLSNLNPGHN